MPWAVFLWLASTAWAGRELADEEVVIRARTTVDDAREDLSEAIRHRGYLPGIRLGDRTHYLPLEIWRPRVVVHDAGFIRVKGRTFTPMMVTLGPVPTVHGLWGSPRTTRSMERELVERLMPHVDRWNRAQQQLGLAQREVEVRDQLDQIWFLGVGPDGEPLADPSARRERIARMRANTTDNDAGQRIRDVIDAFVAQHAADG